MGASEASGAPIWEAEAGGATQESESERRGTSARIFPLASPPPRRGLHYGPRSCPTAL